MPRITLGIHRTDFKRGPAGGRKKSAGPKAGAKL